jgi:hypothetical protein
MYQNPVCTKISKKEITGEEEYEGSRGAQNYLHITHPYKTEPTATSLREI